MLSALEKNREIVIILNHLTKMIEELQTQVKTLQEKK